MDILITDVTEMHSGNYCVAGWNRQNQRMIRPLPAGANWTSALLVAHQIVPGVTIRVDPLGTANGAFPHRTEDTPVNRTSILRVGGTFSTWTGHAAPPTAPTLNEGFAGHVQWNSVWNGAKQGVHVGPGTQCSSLAAVCVPTGALSFEEAFGKLKATVFDGSDSYQLTVSSKRLKEAWRAGGLPQVDQMLPNRNILHLRIGLARAFGTPPKCYAMLNGVL